MVFNYFYNLMRKLKVVLVIFIALFAMGLWANDAFADTTVNFSSGKMFAPNCFCASDVTRYNLAPFCPDRNWCNRTTSTQTVNVPAGRYAVRVNVTDLTASQRYESVIVSMNGQNYTVPDLGGNADSTGTGTHTIGTFNLSGNVTFRGTHRYATTFTGLWYSDAASRIGSGNAMESVNISSIVLDDIVQAPTCAMNAAPTTINRGQSATLSWTSTNATSATINQGIGGVAVNGSRTVSPSTTTTYTGTFTGAGGTVTCARTITVVQPPAAPTCALNAAPTTINQGQSATLSWTSTNATSASINQGIGGVAVNGSRTVSPSTTTTYTGTFTGAGGTVTCARTITVVPRADAPTCTLSAAPTTIDQGQSATLSWTSTNATSASINQGIGGVAVNGSRTVSPSTTTTYTGTFTGAGGTVTCHATVTVTPRPDAPTCSMNAAPANITAGGSSTLTWSSTNTTSASINQGIGAVAVNGSRSVSPASSTTYTGTFTGPGGTVTCNASVTVGTTPPPPPPPPGDDDEEEEEDDADCDGSIGDYIWNDEDGDGKQDENEKGLASIRVKLTNFTNDDESTLWTTKNGRYEFKDLCEGEYRVTVKKQDVEQYTQTYDPDGTKNNKTEVTLRGHDDHHKKADFGYKGKPVAPRTGSGETAIYISSLLSLAGLATYLKIRKTKAFIQK